MFFFHFLAHCLKMDILLLERLKCILYHILVVCLLWDTCTAKSFPAVFIFGDSMVDAGNNFYLDTIARAVLPNGIDFGTGKASGRFTNGRTFTDFIEQKLGFRNFSPPYLSPMATGEITQKGVNYGSSASGIFSDTNTIYGVVLSMDKQIDYFEKTKQDIMTRIGSTAARSLIRQSLYLITMGANDIQSVLGPSLTNSSLDAYFDKLISKFRSQLTRLYYLGARKIVVTSCASIGYIPHIKETYPDDKNYMVPSNQVARNYNDRLKKLLTELTTSLTGSIYVYADLYALLENIIQNAKASGFENVDSACCRVIGPLGGSLPCFPESQVCMNRNKYVFWDPFHPTEAANLIIANHLMDGGLNYISPMNVRQLLKFPVS